MSSLCDCPVCGGRLWGKLSSKLFIQNTVLCDSCGFTERLTEAVARYDGSQPPDDDVPIFRPSMFN
jgi:hypothetical protein